MMVSSNEYETSVGAIPVLRDAVVLVHGMFSSHRSMGRLACLLRDAGYSVFNWSYHSLLRSIEVHAERLHSLLVDLSFDERIGRVHVITHSMGGIIARCALLQIAGPKVGRMVMLAPPNSGSHLTRIPLGPFSGVFPALAELSIAPDSFVNTLPEPEQMEVGIIAAASDRVVDLRCTQLLCQCDHVVLPGSHQALPRLAETGRQVVHFLENARFATLAHSAGAAPCNISAERASLTWRLPGIAASCFRILTWRERGT